MIPSISASEYKRRVACYPCCVCGAIPADPHHASGGSMNEHGVLKGGALKVSHFLTIPLCRGHHTGADGIHTLGVETWELRFGLLSDHVTKTGALLRVDVWTLAAADTPKLSRRAKLIKTLPRFRDGQ